MNEQLDQDWADQLSPSRRSLLGAGIASLGAITVGALPDMAHAQTPDNTAVRKDQLQPTTTSGNSEWGYETYREPTPQPISVRADQAQLPTSPRPYTAVKSYHAHVYFDEDTAHKAALLRKWAADRFAVELGNWNKTPRGPHVTPSFYFGFTLEQMPVIIPWLQLNSLGLTILIHPNTDNPRADHLDYALWVNRSQPVNAYSMETKLTPGKRNDLPVYPNTRPSILIET